MPTLLVHGPSHSGSIPFAPGLSLRDLLNTGELPTRSACRGIGACGLCRVRVEGGEVTPPTPIERLHLEPEQLAAGVRLACQFAPAGDLEVTLLNPAPPSVWRTLPENGYLSPFPPRPHRPGAGRFGAAVDLGTTHISVALCDLPRGRRLAMRYGPNPQGTVAADIIGRLVAADEAPEQALRLQQLALEAIGSALMEISVREGLSLYEIGPVAVVGNTAMLTLLAGENFRRLLDPRVWMEPLPAPPPQDRRWHELWNLAPSAHIQLVPALAGFVGSDLLTGLVHAGLHRAPEPALFIDFGTNSEIALWDGERFLATSAAGGPAFEGEGIPCGMAAEPGAIARIRADGEWQYEVIGGGAPAGLCGSGLIDLAALLLARGDIDPLGRLARHLPERLPLPGTRFWIGKHDLDLLQRAKAAIGAGVQVLCDQAGLPLGRVARVYVGGAFGRYLDPQSAAAIGLLPPLPPERLIMLGNSALNGCQDLLVSAAAADDLERIRAQARVLNLSTAPAFEEQFLDHLYLRPLEV